MHVPLLAGVRRDYRRVADKLASHSAAVTERVVTGAVRADDGEVSACGVTTKYEALLQRDTERGRFLCCL